MLRLTRFLCTSCEVKITKYETLCDYMNMFHLATWAWGWQWLVWEFCQWAIPSIVLLLAARASAP